MSKGTHPKYFEVSPSILLAYEMNNKIHDEENVQQIANSIKEIGFRDPVEIDENMEILSGHGRVLAAKKLNIKNIPVVQYFDMNEEQKRRYRHYANRIADFSRYNLENIQKEILETGDTELLKLYEEFKLTLPETEYDTDNEDIVPTMSTKTPIVQIGDIFQLGQHYIICGDSTKEETYKQLLEGKKADVIITDPPYNVNYKGQGKNTKQGIKNDNMSSSEFYNFLNNAFHSISSYSKQHTPMYIFHSHKTQMIFEMTMNQNNINIISQLIRNKPSINHVGGDYKQKHEPFFYASNGDPKRYGDVYQETVLDARRNLSDQKLLQLFKSFLQAEQEGRTTIFSVQRHNVQDYVHPTQKPVRLIEIMMHNSSHIQDVVLDPFLGSGTTLITAEKTQRICYGIELDRKYIEVIIARYRKFTKNNGHIKCLNRQIDINKIIDNV